MLKRSLLRWWHLLNCCKCHYFRLSFSSSSVEPPLTNAKNSVKRKWLGSILSKLLKMLGIGINSHVCAVLGWWLRTCSSRLNQFTIRVDPLSIFLQDLTGIFYLQKKKKKSTFLILKNSHQMHQLWAIPLTVRHKSKEVIYFGKKYDKTMEWKLFSRSAFWR